MSKRIMAVSEPVRQKVTTLGTEGLRWLQARVKAFNAQNAVLVHGDAHSGNTLQSLSQSPSMQPAFKFIDPDGLFAEAAYDLGVLMREWLDELLTNPVSLGRERCTYLSHLTGADPQATWQWGFIQCMATGLLLTRIGQELPGRQMLKVAEAWARA